MKDKEKEKEEHGELCLNMVYYRGNTTLIIMLSKKMRLKKNIIRRFENQKVDFGLYPADNWESFNILSNGDPFKHLFSTSSIHFAWHNGECKGRYHMFSPQIA